MAGILTPYLGDPVVAIGVDHAAPMFFRTGAFDLDYHPDALTWWADAIGDVPAPRAWDPASAGICAHWVLFKDEYVARSLGKLAAMLDDAGLGSVARFHDVAPGHHGLYDLRWIQREIAGPVGIAAYSPRERFPELRQRAAALVGNARPIPIAFDVGVEVSPWLPPRDLERDDPMLERDHVLTLLASGVRGLGLRFAAQNSWIQPVLTRRS